MLTTKTVAATVRGGDRSEKQGETMYIQMTKGTNVKGIGPVRAGSVLDAPGMISEGTARFLVNYGAAIDVTPDAKDKDAKAPTPHLVTKEAERAALGLDAGAADKTEKPASAKAQRGQAAG